MIHLAFRDLDRSSPWYPLKNWTQDFDQLLHEVGRARTSASRGPSFACDVHETESDYLLTMDIPGIHPDDIDLECTGNHMTLAFERKQQTTAEDSVVHRLERPVGAVKRTFTLPEGVDLDRLQARVDHGVLYLAVPKKEVIKSRKIQITAGKSACLQEVQAPPTESNVPAANC
ncbi:MAG: Hsp20/alpha crystallin family protein [Zetaproteobacteria bacterium]|nr:Hsp20/alpha crystallin family protein [Zetaproteobacteria bacterium]